MSLAEEFGNALAEVTGVLAQQYRSLSASQLDAIRKLIRNKFEPLLNYQPSLNFDAGHSDEDQRINQAQCERMIALFKRRRSQGVLTWELADIALKYSSRIDDLRKAGWIINCAERVSTRVYRYILSPEQW